MLNFLRASGYLNIFKDFKRVKEIIIKYPW